MGSAGSKQKKKTLINSGFEKAIAIIKNKGVTGLGILCKLPLTDKTSTLPALITTIDLIGKAEIEEKKQIEFLVENSSYTITIDEERNTFINEDKYKIVIIEIKDDDNLSINSFFEFEENVDPDKIRKSEDLGVVIKNDKEKKIEYMLCEIKKINENGYDMDYQCKMNEIFLIGNPIINTNNNKLIGIQKSLNKGILLSNPIKEFVEKNMKQKSEAKSVFKSLRQIKTLRSTIRVDQDKFNKELTLTYLVPDKNIVPILKIFGEDFVKKNKKRCKLILYDEEKDVEYEYELGTFLTIDEINKVNHGEKFFRLFLVQTDYIFDLSMMFHQCATLLSVEGLSGFNTEQVTTMSGMFDMCVLLQEVDMSNMDTSKVKDVSFMFEKCASLKSLDFSGWDASKIKTTKAMFEYCESLEEITGFDGWNVSSLKDTSFMFNFCKKLKKISDMSNWNTSNFVNMAKMFKGMESITEFPDISKWNTNKVTDMSILFGLCSSLTSLPDISNWDTENLETLQSFCLNCASLKSLPDLSKWNTSKVTNFSRIFGECFALESIPDISKWDMSSATHLTGFFHQCQSVKSLPDISNQNGI